MSLKATKITFWISTVLFSVMMLNAAFRYFFTDEMVAAFDHLGFPGYFRIELGIAKVLGVIALLAPVPARLKDWAYAGFTITLISAFIAHVASGDSVMQFMMPVATGVVLALSYYSFRRWLASANEPVVVSGLQEAEAQAQPAPVRSGRTVEPILT